MKLSRRARKTVARPAKLALQRWRNRSESHLPGTITWPKWIHRRWRVVTCRFIFVCVRRPRSRRDAERVEKAMVVKEEITVISPPACTPHHALCEIDFLNLSVKHSFLLFHCWGSSYPDGAIPSVDGQIKYAWHKHSRYFLPHCENSRFIFFIRTHRIQCWNRLKYFLL